MARSRYQTDEKKYARFFGEGRGRGYGADYRPFLQIDDLSSSGRSHRIWTPVTGREHHLLSDGEYYNLHLKWWDASTADLREQFPLPRAKTLAIADALGVRHPMVYGTVVVMTTDLLTTRIDGTLCATAVKLAQDADLPRGREKLAIERVYWEGQGIEWECLTEADLKTPRARNIVWALKALSPQVADPGPLGDAVIDHLRCRPAFRARHACLTFDDAHGLKRGSAASLLRLMIALRRVEVDMSARPVMENPTSMFRRVWP